MADDKRVGTLEEESLKRKERLKALKRKHSQTENLDDSENKTPVSLPKPKFRSYRPVDESLKDQVIEDAKPGDVENEIKSHLEAANSKVVIEALDDEDEKKESPGEEFQGEEYGPQYICVKRQVPEEEVCLSEVSSCTEARTTTGNILERLVPDPFCRRPPCLAKWPAYPPRSESDFQQNIHQYRAAQQPTGISQMCSLRVTSEPNIFRQPAIIGTIGPACWDVANITELLESGVNIIRISMAHTNPCSKTEPFTNIIEATNQYKTQMDFEVPIGIMLDLKGQEIRTGKIDPLRKDRSPKEVFLKQGTIVRLTTDKIFENRCSEKMVYFNYDGSLKNFREGMVIFLADGAIKLRVDAVESLTIVCIIDVGGTLTSDQKVHIPLFPRISPALTDFDMECMELAVKMNVDMIVVPNTRNEEIIKQVKNILDQMKEDHNIMVLAKLTSYEGLENIDDIIRVADGIVVQKNDLSFDLLPEKMFIAQKQIIAKCNRVGKPVICTGQLSLLNSSNGISQRVEVNDIAGAIVDGADGIILIKETALYDEGVEAVTQLSRIMREAEAATMQKPFHFDLVDEQIPSIEPSKAIAMAAVQIANKIQAAAILAVTTSGRTAQMLSWFRPRPPVIAITRVGKTARQLNLWRAIIPLHFTAPVLPDWFHDVKARFEYGVSYGTQREIINTGDLLVLVSGFRKKSGFTNCIRIVFANLEKNAFADNLSNYYNFPTNQLEI